MSYKFSKFRIQINYEFKSITPKIIKSKNIRKQPNELHPWTNILNPPSLFSILLVYVYVKFMVSISLAKVNFFEQCSFRMWTNLVWISLANFRFYGQCSLCIRTTLVWIRHVNFHSFGQHWISGRGEGLLI